MSNGVGKGAFVLIVSGLICKVFGAFFRLPLTNIIGIEGIGAFQMIMSLYSLMLVLTTSGVTVGLARLVSSARAQGKWQKIGAYLRLALLFSVGLALGIGVLFYILAQNIASVQGIGKDFVSYKLMLPLLVTGALIGVFRGIIQGYENMVPTAISQVLEQVTKFALGLGFAFVLGRNGQGVFGAMLGITASEVVAFFYLFAYILAKVRPNFSAANVGASFFNAVIPITLSDMVIPLTHAVDSLLIVSRLSLAGIGAQLATSLYGLQTGVVGAILNFPLVISLSVSVALLPKVSFLSSSGQTERQREVVKLAFSLMWVLLLPFVFGLMAVSPVIYPLIYPSVIKNLLPQAVLLTFLGGIGIILTAIMQFALSLAQGMGYFYFSLLACVVGGATKIVIVIVLAAVPSVNIYAVPLSNIALSAIVCIMLLVKLGRTISLPAFDILTPLLSAFVMFMAVWVFVRSVTLSHILTAIFSVFIGATIYIVLSMPVLLSLMRTFIEKIKNRRG